VFLWAVSIRLADCLADAILPKRAERPKALP
jgi:hypothetical protein